ADSVAGRDGCVPVQRNRNVRLLLRHSLGSRCRRVVAGQSIHCAVRSTGGPATAHRISILQEALGTQEARAAAAAAAARRPGRTTFWDCGRGLTEALMRFQRSDFIAVLAVVLVAGIDGLVGYYRAHPNIDVPAENRTRFVNAIAAVGGT